MGIFCTKCSESDSDLDLISAIKEEIEFPHYYSKGDVILDNLSENNLLKNMTLVEYINLLSYINKDTINKNFDGPFKMNFSYLESKNFLNSNISYELFESFITKNILSHRTLGDKETTFLDMCLEIYKILKIKLIEHYNNNNFKITKKDLLCLGLFFTKGTDYFKIKLIFDLFKNNKNEIEKSDILDEFLLCNFLIGSYCLISARQNMSQINPLISEASFEKLRLFLNVYNLNNCERLVEYFDHHFFNGMKMTFYEYKLKFKDFNGFGWIFSPEGIRQKLEENKFFEY